MKQFLVIAYILMLAFTSCNNPTKPIAQNESLPKKIDSLEMILFHDSMGTVNQKVSQELMLTYEKYVNQNPDDSLTADYLFRNAQIALSLKLGSRSVNYLEQFCTKYPQHPKAPHALFLEAFVYETELNKPDVAKQKYQEFIDKYPKSELYLDAKASLQNIGKSGEELINEFEKKNTSK